MARFGPKPKSLACRFWLKVVRRETGCLEWIGALKENGYGTLGGPHVPSKYAHRVRWIMANGPIPKGMHVCHRCDNPRCVNINHLFLGTRSDNMMDAWKKGRLKPMESLGEKNGRAVLAECDVIEIRSRYPTRKISAKEASAEGERYGVSRYAIWDVVHFRNWLHIGVAQ